MKKKLLIVVMVLTLTGGALLSGQDRAIQTVVPFLLIAPDSRAGGMGDAGVATSPDVYSQHWNPAKFAFIDGNRGIAISYSPWLRNLVPDINIAYITGYNRIDNRQVLSGSLVYSSLGKIDFTDENGALLRPFTPNEFAIDLGYSRMFSDNFSGGIAFRFIYSNLTGGMDMLGVTKAGISFAADISAYYRKSMNLGGKDGHYAFGLDFSNIGSKMNYSEGQTADFIPMNFRIGSSVGINIDDHNKINASIDFNKLLVPTPPIYNPSTMEIISGRDPNVAVPVAFFTSWIDAPGGFKEELREFTWSPGLEYWYNDQFALRGGYFGEAQSKGNRKYFTAGAGFRLKVFTIDFSYLMPLAQNHPLAHTLRFSLSFDLNPSTKSSVN